MTLSFGRVTYVAHGESLRVSTPFFVTAVCDRKKITVYTQPLHLEEASVLDATAAVIGGRNLRGGIR